MNFLAARIQETTTRCGTPPERRPAGRKAPAGRVVVPGQAAVATDGPAISAKSMTRTNRAGGTSPGVFHNRLRLLSAELEGLRDSSGHSGILLSNLRRPDNVTSDVEMGHE